MRAVRDTNNLSDLSEISISICWGRGGVVRSYNQRGVPIKVTVARKKKKRKEKGKRRRKSGQVRLDRDDARRNKRMDERMNGWRKERLKTRRGKKKGIYIYVNEKLERRGERDKSNSSGQ